MAKYFLLSIIVTSILVSGNSASLRIPGWADTVYIHGEIKTSRQKNNSIVTFHVNDYVTGKHLNYYSTIDSLGKFDVKFFLRNTQDIFWRYNKDSLFRLIISPKDSLTIIINKGGIHFSGPNAKASEDINIMRSPYRKAFSSKEEEKAVGHLEPEGYLTFRRQQKDKQIKFLESFCKSRNCSALFRQWYLADCEVNYYNELLAYGWKSLKYGVGSTERRIGERKENYLSSFMIISEKKEKVPGAGHVSTSQDNIEDKSLLPQPVNLDDEKYALSSKYYSIINNLSHQFINYRILNEGYFKDKINYLLEFRNELSPQEVNLLEEIIKTSKTERDIDSLKQIEYYAIVHRYKDQIDLKMLKRYFDWIVSETLKIENSNVRDLIFCQHFSSYIETHDDADYYYNLIAPKISNTDYLKIITTEYNEVKHQSVETNQLLLSELKNIEVTKIEVEKSGDQLINAILLANKNKVIFIDLWGTWCGPCRADFVKMAQLKASPLFDSVSFVYLCCLSKESDWINTIKKYNLKGAHYFVTDGQYAALEKRFKIQGFPTYLVIDKQRNLHKDIMVSDTKVLTEQIRKFVNKEAVIGH